MFGIRSYFYFVSLREMKLLKKELSSLREFKMWSPASICVYLLLAARILPSL